jgi:hypothetical protein
MNYSKQTQSNPTCGELVESTCSELAYTERGRSVEPIADQPSQFSKFLSKTPYFSTFFFFLSPFFLSIWHLGFFILSFY